MFFCLPLFAVSFLAAQEIPGARSGAAAPLSADLSVTAFVEAAKGLSLEWRPDWPLSIPPDIFYTLPESGAAGLTVSFEAPKESFAEQAKGEAGESAANNTVANGASDTTANGGANTAAENAAAGDAEISVEWQNGRLLRFPVFRGSSFTRAAAQYDASGILDLISGEDLEMAVLESDEEGRPVIVRTRTEEGYFFTALEYAPGRVTETWYDENGLPQSVFSTDETGDSLRINYMETGAEAETRRFFFNSFGSISAIISPKGTRSALYERRGFPGYLERDLGNGTERYSFQWDEAGRLVRLSGVRGGERADSRFEYELDDRGNWIVRREITMINRSGRLFPAPGPVVRRRIQYGDGP